TNQQQLPKDILKNLKLNFLDNFNLNKSSKVAYVSSMAPVEILKAFGFKLFFPENHAVIIGSKRLELLNIQETLKTKGYSENCCSYMLTDTGSYLRQNSPLSDFKLPPKPDLIVYNTNQCIEIKQWLNFYASFYKVPIYGIETPHSINKNNKIIIECVVKQIENLIENIEKDFNIKLNRDYLKEIVTNSNECSKLWQEILNLNKINPVPITFFDHCNFMAASVFFRGELKANDFYLLLLKELKEQIKQESTERKKDQYRLIWAGLPVWGRLKYMSTLFSSLNTSLVNSIYASSWVFDLDENDPIESLAKAYTHLFINLTDNEKELFIINLVQQWSADGIIFHHSVSCKRNSDNYYGLSKRLLDTYNIPSFTFEADHCNLKLFNNKQFSTLTEALLDQIEGKRRK
ncbi:MAG: 2-hydroxyacyl-CoA dehydratase family protein, partial [Cyanobacteriota bacterium]